MGLLCYLLFYPVALLGGAARCASTRIIHCPLKIVPFLFSYVKKSKQIKFKNFVMTLMEIYCYLCRCIRKK